MSDLSPHNPDEQRAHSADEQETAAPTDPATPTSGADAVTPAAAAGQEQPATDAEPARPTTDAEPAQPATDAPAGGTTGGPAQDSEPEPEPAPAPPEPTRSEPASQPGPEPAPVAPESTGSEPASQPSPAPAAPEPAPETATPGPAAAPAGPAPTAETPTRPRPPSPASIKPHAPSARPTVSTTAPVAPSGDAASFGRVTDDGVVLVRTPDGEREVGSYPEATPEEALAYFARKYDELAAAAGLLLQRIVQTDLSTHDGQEALRGLRQQVGEAHVVGDLAALDATIEQIATSLKAKAQVEGEAKAKARSEAAAQREALVSEAEQIAGQPVDRVQWKSSTARMRALLGEWKELQRSGAKLDKPTENALWQRFSHARNGFDKSRRAHFARLDVEHAEVAERKEKLIAEAERLAASKDWGPTATAFKRLMGQWRQAGRASRQADDALWARFKAAQDAFFAAKDEVAAEENKQFEANLVVKEQLLKEAQALLPVRNLGAAKAALHGIQDKWEAAGKVPRKDLGRIEQAMRKVEQSVREAEDAKWTKTDPELAARAQSMADQLERAVADLEAELAAARDRGDTKKATSLEESLTARRAWLEQARGGLSDSDRG